MTKTIKSLLLRFAIVCMVSAATAAQAQAKDFLWQVKSKTNTVYLYGTVHVGKPSFYPLPETVTAAFKKSARLTFKIIKDSTLKVGEKIQLVQKQKVDGLLKSKLKTPNTYNIGDLICEFSDKKNTLLYTEIMEDPLTASVEYPAENGTFKRAVLDKKEADLFLRIQNNALIYKLKISKVMPDGKIQIIADFLI